jgi:hypothetical protein
LRHLLVLIAIAALTVAACSGAEPGSVASPPGDQTGNENGGQPTDAPQGDPTAGGGGQAGEVEAEPAGPVEPNTIRIGSQVWKRTLPMTTGQCFLYEDDGTLPTSASVWGTLDGIEDSHFSASVGQDGAFGAGLNGPGDSTLYWQAGARNPEVNDLVIELDFEAQTIKGSGTFHSLTERRSASGSFEFICEPEEG